jgi:hypothetical protein
MMPLRPKHGGFLRTVSLGLFIRDYLTGKSPFDTPKIDPNKGSYQSDIFHQYKMALIRTTAEDKATRMEEKQAKKEQRIIDPDKIDELTGKIITRMPYKAHGCRFHSFIVYFSNIQRLFWVEPSGHEEPSEFQAHYPAGQPRKYFRLTKGGLEAGEDAWRNPLRALYGKST